MAVARALGGDGSAKGSYLLERLKRDLAACVPQAEALVADASGIPAPLPVRWGLVDRSDWVEANIRGMVQMLGPLADKLGRRLDAMPLPTRVAQTVAVSGEVGALLGFISRRVLGQYDLLVPEDDHARTPLYFVGSNMVEVERKFGFVPEDFALWVSLHEVTHRFQFEGVPWLRPRFLELVHAYLDSIDLDAKGLSRRLGSAFRRLVSRSVPAEEKSPMYLFATDEQRKWLDEIQALMTVVEGHGNYVMDSIGREVIPSFEQMRHVFNRRREQTSALQRAIGHAIGLEMKLRQYEIGQRFCEEIVAKDGPAALARLWRHPTDFPTMQELREPRRWLDRSAA